MSHFLTCCQCRLPATRWFQSRRIGAVRGACIQHLWEFHSETKVGDPLRQDPTWVALGDADKALVAEVLGS